MIEPRWNDPDLRAGTMVRGALWLLQVVGEGNIFTKEQVREAFPRISQADRRIRDLRDHGWIITTNSEDAVLGINEQRFVAPGARVWEKGVKRSAGQSKLSSRQRLKKLADANYQCQRCGISAGQRYPDVNSASAVLVVEAPSVENATVVCMRCHAGNSKVSGSKDLDVWRELELLTPNEKSQLLSWIRRNRRGVTSLDRAWRAFSDLEQDERNRVLSFLDARDSGIR